MTRQLSGQVVVAAAGTAVQFTTGNIGPGTYRVKALGGNTGNYMFVGNSSTGDVTSSNGYQLTKAVDSILVTVTDLSELWLDTDTNGDGVCWIRVIGESVGVRPPGA
jgi:hypothetical protein